jgi:predicted nucleotidyltransferase
LAAVFGCASRERQILFERIARIHRIAVATSHLARFVVFGSFVSQKSVPNDVDIFMVFEDAFDASKCDHETMMLLDHATADTYWRRTGHY